MELEEKNTFSYKVLQEILPSIYGQQLLQTNDNIQKTYDFNGNKEKYEGCVITEIIVLDDRKEEFIKAWIIERDDKFCWMQISSKLSNEKILKLFHLFNLKLFKSEYSLNEEEERVDETENSFSVKEGIGAGPIRLSARNLVEFTKKVISYKIYDV